MENRAEYKTSFIEKNTDLPFYTETYKYRTSSHGNFHSHEFFEIGIVLEGTGIHYVNQQKIHLEPGSTYLIPIGTPHSLETFDTFLIQNLYILPKIMLENLGIPADAYSIFMDFFLNCIIKNQENPIHLKLDAVQVETARYLIHLYRNAPNMLPQLLRTYHRNLFNNLLLLLCESWIRPSMSNKKGLLSRNIQILHLIYENINQPISKIIEITARHLELNPQYLNRLVKQSFHTTLSQLILETKLEKSCQLLAKGGSVTEVSLSLAFYDHSHYTRYFTKYFGISPSEYRRRHSAPDTLQTDGELERNSRLNISDRETDVPSREPIILE